MQIELCRGKTYVYFASKKMFQAGVTYEVSDEEGRTLLEENENGFPYFRLVKPVEDKAAPSKSVEKRVEAQAGDRLKRTQVVRKAVQAAQSVETDTAEGRLV